MGEKQKRGQLRWKQRGVECRRRVEQERLAKISQDYYWREDWQRGEREADEDIEAGRVREFDTVEEAIKWLEQDFEEAD